MISDNNTIVAIATALNNSGISIIRLSGEDSISIIHKIFKPKNVDKDITKVKSHTIHYGYIVDNEVNVKDQNDVDNINNNEINNIVDEVLVSIMRGPNSYTAEDVVEINCHGGVIVTKKILDICIKSGARIAQPGEFTKRAFLNGRIDLSQAEAVTDLINAKNDYAAKSSINHLRGDLKQKIEAIRECVIHDIAFIEAALDDPEHYDVDDNMNSIKENICNCVDKINKMYETAENGRIIKEGINTVIVGKPNAGKSSFLNALLGEERAIVTDIEGTTRDVLCEEVNIDGIILNLVDTAGIRETNDIVEKIGVDKAREYVDSADLVIYIVDASEQLDNNDINIIDSIKDKNVIVLLNKSDLGKQIIKEHVSSMFNSNVSILDISAKFAEGISEFEQIIKDKFYTGKVGYNDEVYITNMRHKEALFNAKESLNNVLESLEMGMPEDLFLVDMMSAYSSLGLIIGAEVEDDLVDKIFKEFCMGK